MVAKEFWEFFERCEKQGIEQEHSAYLAFCIVGGKTLEHSPESYYRFIGEIVSKNAF